jgi:tetratricopeptide (TPR) repeat protein
MKRTILFLAGMAAASGLAVYYAAHPTKQSVPSSAPIAVETSAGDPAGVDARKPKHPQKALREPPAEIAASNQAGGPPPASAAEIAFTAAFDTLVSPASTYAEKQWAWKQLQESGRLADAAAELERLKAADPQNAAYPAALGQAYLKLCAATTDVRQQGIWALTADTDFDAALNLDPSNWDARYTKAVAMSYWPANLNKGDEVIQQFTTLVGQQEQEAPQPQFAQTYEWLGNQYQKAGQLAAAQQVWGRGASLYPEYQPLQNLLTASSPGRQ